MHEYIDNFCLSLKIQLIFLFRSCLAIDYLKKISQMVFYICALKINTCNKEFKKHAFFQLKASILCINLVSNHKKIKINLGSGATLKVVATIIS